jgi:hypothetical protein
MLVLIGFVFMSAIPTPTRSETQIAGASGAVSVDAHDTTLQSVIAKLSATFGFRFRSSADLNRPINGSYRGSLREVVTRLLDGYDFVLYRSDEVTEVVVVRRSGMTTAAAPVATAAPPIVPPSRNLRRSESTSGRY